MKAQLNKAFFILFFAVFIILASIFGSRMISFEKNLEKNTAELSCSEENNRVIAHEKDCYYKYNGSPILKNFENVPPHKVCCQLKQ